MSDEIVPHENINPRGLHQALIPKEWGLTVGNAGYVTKIDDSTPAGKMLVYRLMTEEGLKIDQFLNVEIDVTNYLLSVATFNDRETGEVIQTCVTRLLLADERWIETHSSGVAKTLTLLVQFFGSPPWSPPLRVKPERQALRDAKSWVVLRLADQPTAPKPARGRPKES